VSGLLHESNLLMYDRGTESLWSQSRGEAVIGERTGDVLDLVFQQHLTFDEVRALYPDALILSKDTGHSRDYDRNPYAGYEEDEDTFFPVSVDDQRFFSKELMWSFRVGDAYVAFPYEQLGDETLTKEIEGSEVVIGRDGSAVVVTVDGEPVPGYMEMWFSWATQHQEDGVVWELEE
jgi:hypothetical protein